MTATLRPLGLTHVQFVLLASIWWITVKVGGSPTQRQLADHAGTDPMMTSQVLRALEGKGLILRLADDNDSRARRLSLTPQGLALAPRAVEAVEAADGEFFAAAGEPFDVIPILQRLAEDLLD
ncbi:MAG TPA: MarR family transcriptional regulator [Candidatus Dormibacteraeota bacterium]|jgi:DNA-binding MarR family transcriptional regulator|nr:MarR family transcriptional regulator [Candidatus Dormibacteraeota bacterium]